MADSLRDALEAVLNEHECTQPDTPTFNRTVLDDLLAAVAAAEPVGVSDSLRDALLGVLRDHRFLNGHPMDERKAMVDDLVAAARAGHPVEPAGVSDEAVEAALDVIHDDGHNGLDCRPDRNLQVTVRAALEAAQPFMQPQVVASRERVTDALEAAWLAGAEAKTVDSPRGHCERLTDALLAAGVFREPPTEAELAVRISDPGAFLPRGDNYQESIPCWSARAVLNLLGGAGINSTLYTCTGCGVKVIGHETCGDPTRPECAK